MIHNHRSMFFLGPKYFFDNRNRPFVKPLREVMFTYNVGALLERDSPLLDAVNYAVAAIQGGGFRRQWLAKIDKIVQRQVGCWPDRSPRVNESSRNHFDICI